MNRARSAMTVFVCALMASFGAIAQSKSAVEPREGDIPLEQFIQTVSKKTGKKFVLDPRARANVTSYGISSVNLSYSELLAILSVNKLTAVDIEGVIHIVPVAEARYLPIPTVTATKQYDDNEFVTKIIHVKSIPAPMLVALLRPIVDQAAHFVSITCTNTLIIVDRYGSVKRLSAVIESLDKGEPLKGRDCSIEESRK